MAAQSPPAIYAWSGLEIDLARRELRSRGVPLPIGSRAFDILEILVRSGGELVNKYDLIDQVWPGAVVEENTLRFHIFAIRKAFGADRPMLKTVSGRGYRLLGAWTAQEATQPEHPVGVPAIKPRHPRRTNVPAAGSALIGRNAPRQHLLEVLSAYRIVTLTGPGGIGKSTLALDVARHLFPIFEGDRWFIELASLSDPSHVPSTVASVLGLQMGSSDISAESIARTIGAEKVLIILDNCEHLVDAAASFAEVIVRMCPSAVVLATSREVLRIRGEYVYRVPALEVPPAYTDGAVNIGGFSAVQLFEARLTALDSGFAVARESLPLIASVCRRLDGIPLAIEFAAAGAATLGLQQISDRLNDRFRVLTAGRRTALPRQQTLQATLDWSYELLPDSERTLLRRLGTFMGGFTLEAATALMSDTGATASMVAEGIASLASKSLVFLDASVSVGRWRLLETIRVYALDKLAESGETKLVVRRHAEFFRTLFEPATMSPFAALDDLSRYAREIDNLRAALDWAFSREASDGRLAVGLAVVAAPILLAMSLLLECHRWSERALLALDDSQRGAAEEMHLQAGLGYSLMFTQGGSDAARAALESSLAIAERHGDALYQLWLLNWLNVFHWRNGNFTAALQYAERSSAVANISGNPAAIGSARFVLGNSLYVVGQLAEARVELEAALQEMSPHSPQTRTIYLGVDHHTPATMSLANTLCFLGFPHQAAGRAGEALKDAERIDHPIVLSIVLRHAILLFLWIGDLPRAEHVINWYTDNAQLHSLAPQVTAGCCFKGWLAIRRGDALTGVELLQRSIAELRTARYGIMTSEFNIALAEGLAATGRLAESMKLIDDSIRLVEANGDLVYMPELLRVKGNLLLAMPRSGAVDAETHLTRSLELARQQGARTCELRTATDLARLMEAHGRHAEARALLEQVLGWFTEGFGTPDLKSAQQLLAVLTPASSART